jgi:hypothetical protein
MGQEEVSSLSGDEFKARISRLVSLMGYAAESSKPADQGFFFLALKPEPLGPVKTLIYVSTHGHPVSQNRIKEVLNLAKDHDSGKTVLISSSGFSEGAMKYSAHHGVTAIDKIALEDLMRTYSISTLKQDKLFEFSFGLGRTNAQAQEYFEKQRGKKLFGFGVEEKIEDVSGRYAPVGSFLITRDEEVATGISKTAKTLRTSNVFYVNLHTNELYYISKGIGKPVQLQTSGLLNRLMLLPVYSVRMLSGLFKHRQLSIEELNSRYELYYEDNMNDFMLLSREGLAAPASDRNSFMANLTVPSFDNERYDLKKFMTVERSVSSSYEVDDLKYNPEGVVKLLELFFAGRGEIKEVIYLPYYTCTYHDDHGMKRSRLLLAPIYTTSV